MTSRRTPDSRYPLLALIDVARSNADHPFATDPQAPTLERRARELADEYWPDAFWLTGAISPALLDAVTRRLETERESLHKRIHVVVVSEQRSTPLA